MICFSLLIRSNSSCGTITLTSGQAWDPQSRQDGEYAAFDRTIWFCPAHTRTCNTRIFLSKNYKVKYGDFNDFFVWRAVCFTIFYWNFFKEYSIKVILLYFKPFLRKSVLCKNVWKSDLLRDDFFFKYTIHISWV